MWSYAAVVRKIPDGSDEFFAFPDRGRFFALAITIKIGKASPSTEQRATSSVRPFPLIKKFGKKAKRFVSSSRASFTMSLVKYFVRSVDMPKVNVLERLIPASDMSRRILS